MFLKSSNFCIPLNKKLFKKPKPREINIITPKREKKSSAPLITIVKAVAVATVVIIALTFTYREYSYSRLVIGYFYIICVLLVFILHRILRIFRIKLLVPVAGKLGILVVGGRD